MFIKGDLSALDNQDDRKITDVEIDIPDAPSKVIINT